MEANAYHWDIGEHLRTSCQLLTLKLRRAPLVLKPKSLLLSFILIAFSTAGQLLEIVLKTDVTLLLLYYCLMPFFKLEFYVCCSGELTEM